MFTVAEAKGQTLKGIKMHPTKTVNPDCKKTLLGNSDLVPKFKTSEKADNYRGPLNPLNG
eukprot:375411-Amphidinium_carterae.1